MDPSDPTDPTDPTEAHIPATAEDDDGPPPDETALDRARNTGVGADDPTIVGDDQPGIVEDPDPDASPGAVT